MENNPIRQKMDIYAMQIRGHAIHACIELELFMGQYIVKYYTADETKQEEIYCTVFAPRVNFDSIKDIFTFIVDKYHPKFRTTFPKYPDHIKRIIEYRNALAHHPIDLSDRAVEEFKNEKQVSFVKFKNIKEDKPKNPRVFMNSLLTLNDAKYKELMAFIYYYRDAVLMLNNGKIEDTGRPPEV